MGGLAVPIVDLGGFLQGSAGERQQAARAFGHALETAGFVTVVNHGVPAQLVRQTYACAHDFFSMYPLRMEAVHEGFSQPDIMSAGGCQHVRCFCCGWGKRLFA